MATNTEEHPERLDPREHRGDLIDIEHRGRYLWARQLTTGRKVLDAGCGTGYGLELLAEGGASRVVGIDISEVAVDQASHATASDNDVEVLRGDLRDLPFSDNEFDLAVCFEVIEHVEDPETVLDELARVLTPNGLLCVSTPNRRVYPAGNPFHVHEYEPEELAETLRRRFQYVTLYRQTALLASGIFSDDEWSATGASGITSANVIKTASREPGQEIFTIAIAGHNATPSLDSLLALGEPFEVSWWQTRLGDFEKELEKHRIKQIEAERARDDHAAALLDAEADLARTQNDIAQWRTAHAEVEEWAKKTVADDAKKIAESHRDRDDFEARLRRAERTIDDIKTSLSWRVTAPLRVFKRFPK